MRSFIVFASIALLAALTLVHAQPASAPAEAYSATKPRVQTLKETNYLYTSSETTLNKMKPVVEQAMTDFMAAFAANNIRPRGTPVFVYRGATGERDTPFTLEVGFPVEDNVAAPASFKTRKLEATPSATVLYSGSMAKIVDAYRDLYANLNGAAMTPSDEVREHHLYWEGIESANNVVMIQAVLQK